MKLKMNQIKKMSHSSLHGNALISQNLIMNLSCFQFAVFIAAIHSYLHYREVLRTSQRL